jgi:chorismate mutase/prephenate dehydratase
MKDVEKLKSLERQVADNEGRLITLLDERFALAREICEEKRRLEMAPAGLEELSAMLRRLSAIQTEALPADALKAVCREIWSGAAALEQPLGIAFLGPQMTYTHQAAMAMFGSSVHYREQPSIPDVFDAVSRGEVNYGVVPVENSTEGSVTHTLDMFADTELKICAELNLPIHHCLLANCQEAEIDVLYSHPQVFGQCRRWLYRTMPEVKLVEVSSTTEAASRALKEADHAGALASELAAAAYGLAIRRANIEDSTDNTTRFLVLCKHMPEPSGDDKTSILMAIRHRVGALYESLLPFGKHGVNLTFIESRPSKRKNWEYYFFIDFLGHVTEPRAQAVLKELGEICQFVKILGSYPRAADGK